MIVAPMKTPNMMQYSQFGDGIVCPWLWGMFSPVFFFFCDRPRTLISVQTQQ